MKALCVRAQNELLDGNLDRFGWIVLSLLKNRSQTAYMQSFCIHYKTKYLSVWCPRILTNVTFPVHASHTLSTDLLFYFIVSWPVNLSTCYDLERSGAGGGSRVHQVSRCPVVLAEPCFLTMPYQTNIMLYDIKCKGTCYESFMCRGLNWFVIKHWKSTRCEWWFVSSILLHMHQSLCPGFKCTFKGEMSKRCARKGVEAFIRDE